MVLNIFSTFIVLILLFESNRVLSTRYYFSISGNDTNNGLSESTPKKNLIEANRLINLAIPGDIFSFKRGDEWTSLNTITTSVTNGLRLLSVAGTETKPIVVNDYGIGNNPVFKDLNLGIKEGCSVILIRGSDTIPSSHIIIQNIDLQNTNKTTMHGIYITGVGYIHKPSNIRINNCNVKGYGMNYRTREAGYSDKKVIIENCTIAGAWGLAGISPAYSDGIIMRGIKFIDNSDPSDALTHQIYLNSCRYCEIVDNYFYYSVRGGSNIKLGVREPFSYNGGGIEGTVVKRNFVQGGGSGIVAGGRWDNYARDFVISHNFFNFTSGSAVSIRDQGQLESYNMNVSVHSNIVLNCGITEKNGAMTIVDVVTAEGVFFYNNIYILAEGTEAQGFGVSYDIGDTGKDIRAMNNIIFAPESASGSLLLNRENKWNGVTLDRNIYYTEDGVSSIVGIGTGTGNTARYDSLEDFREDFSQFEVNGLETNPAFSVLYNPHNTNYRLKSSPNDIEFY